MPLYQQAGLQGSKPDLSGIPQAIMSYIQIKAMKDKQKMAEEQFGLEKALTGAKIQDLIGGQMTLDDFMSMRKQYGDTFDLEGALENGKVTGIKMKPKTPVRKQLTDTGDVKSVFNPETGQVEKTNIPSSKVASTTVNVSPASASERTAIAETNTSMDILDNLKVLFDNPKTRTGPLVGRIDPILGVIGKTSMEQEDFMAATSAFKNKIIKEITGAQMSEPEAKRIMKQVPDIGDVPKRWLAKWNQSRKNLEMLQARRKEVLKQSGIKVPEGSKEISWEQLDSEISKYAPKLDTASQVELKKILESGDKAKIQIALERMRQKYGNVQ
jgi:hypothetical protein